MTSITFVRHGNTVWNNERRAQGHADNGLSSMGISQAHELASRLEFEEERDLFLSSDLYRAKQTANIVSKVIGQPIDFHDKRLREIDRGKLQGTTVEDRIQRWGKDWSDLDFGVESMESVQERGLDFVKDMLIQFPNKSLLVVSHGILIAETLKGIFTDENMMETLGNTSVTTVHFENNLWSCSTYNCITHLIDKSIS